jgi:hypothetical protein
VDGSSNDLVYLYGPSPKGGLVKKLILPALLCAALLPCTCHYDWLVPRGQPKLVVDGRDIAVYAYLNRDFQPEYPPDGPPLTVYVRLFAPDSQPLPQGLSADHAWLVNRHSIWATDLAKYDGTQLPCNSGFQAHGGPKWDVGADVDVTVRVVLSNLDICYILVPGCSIGRSY